MLQPIFGASMLSWVAPQWKDESGIYAIKKAAAAGFDLIELGLPPSMEINISEIKSTLTKENIQVTCGLNLPKEAHIPTHPDIAIHMIKKAIDIAEQLGSRYLGGVLHGAIGVFSGKSRTKEESDKLIEVWNTVGAYAKTKDIQIGIEPINRYESYVCTSGEEVLNLINLLEVDNISLHLDTFHMNIEENGFYQPVIKSDKNLKYFHMTESDRGMLGEGNVHWEDLFKALSEINYQHPLVLENFTNQVDGIGSPTSLWRPSKYNADDLAKGSLDFMRMMTEKWN
ncbi:sugar phosphate isomerase/epimerase family protein [Rhizosphaericola mali]|uniref:TIM barrel protein n=1 Tax=Rhizosphaericola mali TaxID=2545455 RepID=A0A5P2GD14_9BACT|nr:sugar phosphate isomerase/epimerase family protein [Rhizosphaericola mali]QES89481.1 TIM barrel protein [Rhizosphaericola mali]